MTPWTESVLRCLETVANKPICVDDFPFWADLGYTARMSPTEFSFSERTEAINTSKHDKLLQRKIKDLGLKLEGSRLEKMVQKLYEELEAVGVSIKPKVYLSDEWGCPDGIPIIGAPFYLVDPHLAKIEDEALEGLEAVTEQEIMKYLRHEAGHAFNYAFKLYDRPDFHDMFGPYSRPYKDDYSPNPFSHDFVRHLAGWYAQKHPDEDLAETFAVWMTPDSNWQEAYKDWGCLKKLLYIDRVAKSLTNQPALVSSDSFDISEDLDVSIEDHLKQFVASDIEVPAYFDGDLKDIFDRTKKGSKEDDWSTAAKFLTKHRREIVKNIAHWTGLNDLIVKSLVNHFIGRCKDLDLWVHLPKSTKILSEITAYATTLAMNRLYKGDFVIR